MQQIPLQKGTWHREASLVPAVADTEEAAAAAAVANTAIDELTPDLVGVAAVVVAHAAALEQGCWAQIQE